MKVKKVLHFIFNERNEYTVNIQELKKYGLHKLYEEYGKETYTNAKEYLRNLALNKLSRANVEVYVYSSKIKDK